MSKVDPGTFSNWEELGKYKDVPVHPPPPGVMPNLAAHNQRADVYIIFCSTLLGIVYVFVWLRLYAKIWIKRRPGFDDREHPISSLAWWIIG